MRLEVAYSTSHMFFPRIVIGILIVLGAIILVMSAIQKKKSNQPFFNREWRFLAKGTNYFVLFGSIALLILYIAALKPIGFLAASLIFIFLFNVLFGGTLKLKSLLISAASSAISSTAIWYLFGVVFNITLP